MKRVCLECRMEKWHQARGLCRTCYYTPSIKKRYAMLGRGATGLQPLRKENNKRPRLPKRPSLDRPGTESKLATMEKRFARGEAIFHPLDVTVLADDDRLDANDWTGEHHGEISRGLEPMPDLQAADDDVSFL